MTDARRQPSSLNVSPRLSQGGLTLSSSAYLEQGLYGVDGFEGRLGHPAGVGRQLGAQLADSTVDTVHRQDRAVLRPTLHPVQHLTGRAAGVSDDNLGFTLYLVGGGGGGSKSPSGFLKEITHPRHFFENIVNNFHNTVFHSLFRNTNYFPN